MKILVYDIETGPMAAWIWQAKTDYVNHNMIQHDTFMLSWAAKWAGKGKVFGEVLTPKEAQVQDDTRIVTALADLIREADIIIAHNGDRFDLKMVSNRLLLLGLEPLGDVKTIDTLTLARRSFRLATSRLDYLAKQLGLGGKIKTDFDLWRNCYMGDEKALAKMLRYNKRDVIVLERVYEAMKPYVKGLPRLVDAQGPDERVCPSCGEDALTKRGIYRTNAMDYQKWVCGNCRRTCRSRKAERGNRLGVVPL